MCHYQLNSNYTTSSSPWPGLILFFYIVVVLLNLFNLNSTFWANFVLSSARTNLVLDTDVRELLKNWPMSPVPGQFPTMRGSQLFYIECSLLQKKNHMFLSPLIYIPTYLFGAFSISDILIYLIYNLLDSGNFSLPCTPVLYNNMFEHSKIKLSLIAIFCFT